MLDELTAAGAILSIALERYYATCLAIQKTYPRNEKSYTIDPQFLPRLDAQINLATSLQSTLARAKAAISWSRNCSHTHVTVNDLPSEVLAYVFHMVVSGQPCAKRDYHGVDKTMDLMYPAVLSRVCSRWRSIAFSTPTLWTHIDLSTSTLLNKQHLDGLTKLHLSHVGPLSLDLHLFDASGYEMSQLSHGGGFDSSITGSITRLASRTSSFSMDELRDFSPDNYGKVLSALFQDSTPGTLTNLTNLQYLNRTFGGPGFLNAKEDPVVYGSSIIDLPREQLENILEHVSVLRLAGLYPRWTSRAYHGLVELRLVGGGTVNESDLVGILRSSPGLRILQLSHQINRLLPIDAEVAPIVLRDLEVLIVWQISCPLLPSLLRWLAPGPKPLQFEFRARNRVYAPTSEDLRLKEDSLVSFFLRSHLNRVHGRYMGIVSAIELLELSPGIQELAISRIKLRAFPPLEGAAVGSTLRCRLRYLQISHTLVHIEAVLAFISCPTVTIEVVVFHDCELFYHGAQIPADQVALQVEELDANYPNLRFIVRSCEEPYLVCVGSWGPDTSM
ncbi:hypothetical protein ACGC1H_002164 [Rhizoctonia solani]